MNTRGMNRMFVNYAHRGASSYAPENTLSAFYLGIRMKANGIETDIRRSRDGQLVLFHDDSLERIAGRKGGVSDYTLRELRGMLLGGPEGSMPDRIVTLEEFLYLFGYRSLTFSLEIKQPGVEEDSLKLTEQYGVTEKCIFTSFDYESLRRIRAVNREVRLGYLFREVTEERIREAEAIGCRQLCIHVQEIDREKRDELKSRGFSVRAWGIRTEEDMMHAMELADDGMTVNFPDRLTEALVSRAGKRNWQ